MKLLGFSLRCTADGNRLFPSTLHGLTPISTCNTLLLLLIVFCFDLEQQEVTFKPGTKTYFDIKDNTGGIYVFNVTGASEQGNKRRKSLSKIILLIQTKANGNIEEQRFIVHGPRKQKQNKSRLIQILVQCEHIPHSTSRTRVAITQTQCDVIFRHYVSSSVIWTNAAHLLLSGRVTVFSNNLRFNTTALNHSKFI